MILCFIYNNKLKTPHSKLTMISQYFLQSIKQQNQCPILKEPYWLYFILKLNGLQKLETEYKLLLLCLKCCGKTLLRAV